MSRVDQLELQRQLVASRAEVRELKKQLTEERSENKRLNELVAKLQKQLSADAAE